MKYGKSAMPYLALLFILIIGMPLVNHKMQQTQQVVVEVKVKKRNIENRKFVKSKTNKKESSTLLLMSSK